MLADILHIAAPLAAGLAAGTLGTWLALRGKAPPGGNRLR